MSAVAHGQAREVIAWGNGCMVLRKQCALMTGWYATSTKDVKNRGKWLSQGGDAANPDGV